MEVKGKVRRNPAKTRGRILDAGVALFADRGFTGVAVDEIVAAAGVNKRMLYHYFGSKDGLYVEVLRSVFGRLEELEVEALEEAVPLDEALTAILEAYFGFLEDQPEFVKLLMWENLNRGRFLDDHPDLLSKSQVLARLRKVVKAAKDRGDLADGVDARHLLVLLYGMCSFYCSNRYTLRHTVGLDFSRASVAREGLRFSRDVLLHGLMAGGR